MVAHSVFLYWLRGRAAIGAALSLDDSVAGSAKPQDVRAGARNAITAQNFDGRRHVTLHRPATPTAELPPLMPGNYSG